MLPTIDLSIYGTHQGADVKLNAKTRRKPTFSAYKAADGRWQLACG